MPFIHLPVQSGDSEILKIMGRRYTIEEYRTLFDKIMTRIPGCAVSTDIIVGFPNESDEQFEHTMEIVDYCKFDNAFTFIYSPREGTDVYKRQDLDLIKKKRHAIVVISEKITDEMCIRDRRYRPFWTRSPVRWAIRSSNRSRSSGTISYKMCIRDRRIPSSGPGADARLCAGAVTDDRRSPAAAHRSACMGSYTCLLYTSRCV